MKSATGHSRLGGGVLTELFAGTTLFAPLEAGAHLSTLLRPPYEGARAVLAATYHHPTSAPVQAAALAALANMANDGARAQGPPELTSVGRTLSELLQDAVCGMRGPCAAQSRSSRC